MSDTDNHFPISAINKLLIFPDISGNHFQHRKIERYRYLLTSVNNFLIMPIKWATALTSILRPSPGVQVTLQRRFDVILTLSYHIWYQLAGRILTSVCSIRTFTSVVHRVTLSHCCVYFFLVLLCHLIHGKIPNSQGISVMTVCCQFVGRSEDSRQSCGPIRSGPNPPLPSVYLRLVAMSAEATRGARHRFPVNNGL